MVEESAYQAFFKKALEKTGKSIPDMSDEEKKAFFNKIDSAWKGKGEKKNEGNAFGAAVSQAKKDGDDSFKVDGEEYKVEGNHSNEEEIDEEAAMVHRRTPSGTIVSKLKEENESVVNEDKVSNGTVSTLEKGIQRILGTKVNHDINRNGAHEFYIDDAEFVIGVGDDEEKKVAYSFSIYDDGARKYLGKGTAADEKDLIKQVLSIAKKYKKQLLLTTESVSERMGSDKGAVGNANFNNRLKAMRDDKNSVVAFIDTNKGKKLLKVFKTQQTAKQFTKKNMDTLLNTKGVESVGTMSKKEWDAKEAKYAIK
jgi:hypothetical protein